MKQQVVDGGTNSTESDLVTGRIGETGQQHLLDDLHILVVLVTEHCRNGPEMKQCSCQSGILNFLIKCLDRKPISLIYFKRKNQQKIFTIQSKMILAFFGMKLVT